MLKLSKTPSLQKLFDFDCITLYLSSKKKVSKLSEGKENNDEHNTEAENITATPVKTKSDDNDVDNTNDDYYIEDIISELGL